MNLVTRFLALAERARALVAGAVEIEPLDLDAHWPEIEALLRREEWPFVRADLEVSDAQPGATSFVARVEGVFAGFFTTHLFGDTGYLDMMIVHPDFRGHTIARPLYLAALRALEAHGATGLVVHTTHDSARLIELLGFTPGQGFTLWIREPGPSEPGEALHPVEESALRAVDADAFGRVRSEWIGAMAGNPEILGLGNTHGMVVLRPREGNGFGLDGFYARTEEDVAPLVRSVVALHGEQRSLMCFARCGGALEAALVGQGFAVPEFFVPIGPLVEWRQGETGDVGTRVRSLLWL